MAKLQDVVTPQLQLTEGDAPGTPASGVIRIYAKADGLLYMKDDTGKETQLGATVETFTSAIHATTDHAGVTGVPSITGLLDETAHDLLDHAGLTGVGSSTFTGLSDAPSSYTGQSGKIPAVNYDEDGLEFVSSPPAANGIPTGGGAGKVLEKIDGTDYNAQWADVNAVKIKSKLINIPSFTGKNGYILAYDETEEEFYLKTDDVGNSVRGLCFSINNVDLATTQSIAITAPMALTITGGKLEVGTAPTGAALICDIHKNGVTLWTTQANRPTIAADGTSAAITVPDVTNIAKGDRLLLMIDQVGSTDKGKDLSLTLYCEVV